MKITALLTGRGNNTLKDKNIIEILGKPTLYYPARAAKAVKSISEWYCSSDDDKILSAAAAEGYTPIIRPPELALPTSPHVECIYHALGIMEERGCLPDILVVILANNVTIDPEWISQCINILEKDPTVSAAVPVYNDNDHHPLRAKKILPSGEIGAYIENSSGAGAVSTNRQDLPPCYFLAHNFWVLRTSTVLARQKGQPPWEFMGNKIMPYIISESIDIHDEQDLIRAAEWISSNFFEFNGDSAP